MVVDDLGVELVRSCCTDRWSPVLVTSERSVNSVIVYRLPGRVDIIGVPISGGETYSFEVRRTNGTLCLPDISSVGGDQSAKSSRGAMGSGFPSSEYQMSGGMVPMLG